MTNVKSGPAPDEEGRMLVERLGGRWTSNGGICRCPAHDDRSPSLSVRAGRSRLLLHCFAGCTAGEILRALQGNGLMDRTAAGSEAVGSPPDAGRLTAAAAGIWNASRSLAGTSAELYLAERGLRTTSPELRFHPHTPHGRSPLTRYRPALIAAVRDDSGLTGIHRTFLDRLSPDSSGSAREKAGLGRFGRGAVRLGGIAPIMGIAEGIETALSAAALFGLPCWATLGTERFGLIALPADIRKLLLFLDHDAGGRRAEALAHAAFAKLLPVEARYPPRAGDDWNDVLRAAATSAPTGDDRSRARP